MKKADTSPKAATPSGTASSDSPANRGIPRAKGEGGKKDGGKDATGSKKTNKESDDDKKKAAKTSASSPLSANTEELSTSLEPTAANEGGGEWLMTGTRTKSQAKTNTISRDSDSKNAVASNISNNEKNDIKKLPVINAPPGLKKPSSANSLAAKSLNTSEASNKHVYSMVEFRAIRDSMNLSVAATKVAAKNNKAKKLNPDPANSSSSSSTPMTTAQTGTNSKEKAPRSLSHAEQMRQFEEERQRRRAEAAMKLASEQSPAQNSGGRGGEECELTDIILEEMMKNDKTDQHVSRGGISSQSNSSSNESEKKPDWLEGFIFGTPGKGDSAENEIGISLLSEESLGGSPALRSRFNFPTPSSSQSQSPALDPHECSLDRLGLGLGLSSLLSSSSPIQPHLQGVSTLFDMTFGSQTTTFTGSSIGSLDSTELSTPSLYFSPDDTLEFTSFTDPGLYTNNSSNLNLETNPKLQPLFAPPSPDSVERSYRSESVSNNSNPANRLDVMSILGFKKDNINSDSTNSSTINNGRDSNHLVDSSAAPGISPFPEPSTLPAASVAGSGFAFHEKNVKPIATSNKPPPRVMSAHLSSKLKTLVGQAQRK